eukprot:TRINITY_DN1802_c0_g1_i1.p1 TRINITY_DN1802_c0_g1~~TRINITY_DN1802_c0_g1_i1.p1  ORF type:complete len:941 (-),score=212.16 TRINITY_DN1802_c0_g1_i1:101-2923(-)
MSFDAALRTFLDGFRLPGEAQKIDRCVNVFAERFCKDNPTLFANKDTAYVLSYSVIMLNTDLHNPQVKKKMSLAEFLRNNRGIDNGQDVPKEFLEALYNSIATNEIKIKDEEEPSVPSSLPDARRRAMLYNWQAARMKDKCLSLLRSKLRAPPAEYYPPTYADYVKMMFDVCWYGWMAAYNHRAVAIPGEPLPENQYEAKALRLNAEGYKFAMKVAHVFNLGEEINAFMQSLVKGSAQVTSDSASARKKRQSSFKSGRSGMEGRPTTPPAEGTPPPLGAASGAFSSSTSSIASASGAAPAAASSSALGFLTGRKGGGAEMSRLQENLEKLRSIEKHFVGDLTNAHIFDFTRRFMKEGPVFRVKKGSVLKQRYLFLFNDVLIYATPIPTSQPVPYYFFHRIIPMHGSTLTNLPDTDGFINLFEVRHEKKSILLTCFTEEDKDAWLTAVAEAITLCSDKHQAALEREGRTSVTPLTVCMTTVNFDIIKINKRGLSQRRVLQLDYANKKLNNSHQGRLRREFSFDDVSDCKPDPRNDTRVYVYFHGHQPYHLEARDTQARDTIYHVFKDVIDKGRAAIAAKWKPGVCLKRGTLEKRGQHTWQQRYLLLFHNQFFLFVNDTDLHPDNIVPLPFSGVTIEPILDKELKVSNTQRSFHFRLKTETERNAWVSAFRQSLLPPATQVVLVDPEDTLTHAALPAADENPSITAGNNCASFQVVKTNRRGIVQDRIFQFDFLHHQLNNVDGGLVSKTYSFESISDFGSESPVDRRVSIYFKDLNRYDFYCSTARDKEDILGLLAKIRENPLAPIAEQFKCGTFVRKSYAEKQGNFRWGVRMLYLFSKSLIVYRNDFEQYPDAVLNIRDLTSVSKIGDLILQVSVLNRPTLFRFELKAERDAWHTALGELGRTINAESKPTPDVGSSTASASDSVAAPLLDAAPSRSPDES